MEASQPDTRVNRPAVALLSTLAAAIGLLPYVLFVEHLWLLLMATPLALVLSFRGIRSTTTKAGEHPSITEMLLGGLGAVTLSATVSLMGVMFWGMTWGVLRATAWLDRRVSLPFHVAESTSSPFWFSLVLTSLAFLVSVEPSARSLAKQLYPKTAGLRSAFYSLARFQRGRAALYVLGLVVTLLGVAAFSRLAEHLTHTWWFAVALSYALVLLGVPLQRRGEDGKEKSEAWSAIEAVGALFLANGYTVVLSPRTGREDIDPLLTQTPDLLAEDPEHAFAVAVKVRDAAGPGDWAGIDELLSATWAINRFLHERDNPPSFVAEPLLVVVGPAPAAMVRIYEHQEQIRVLWIEDPKDLWKVQKMKDQEARRARARQLLASLATQPAVKQWS